MWSTQQQQQQQQQQHTSLSMREKRKITQLNKKESQKQLFKMK